MAPGARGANKPIPGGKTVRRGPNQTFPGHSAARDQGKGGDREKEACGGAWGSRASLPRRPAPEPHARPLYRGGVKQVRGQVNAGRRGGSERYRSDLRPTPRPRHPRCLRPLRFPARRSPAPRLERPARAGRGLRRSGALDLGARASEGGRRAARAREGTRGCFSASLKVSCWSRRAASLCAPSNGPRAAGPGQTRGTGE